MKIQAVNHHPAFGRGNLIVKNPEYDFFAGKLKQSKVFQTFLEKFNGDIFIDGRFKKTPTNEVHRGRDEELHKIYLSTKELPKTIMGIIKSWFDPDFRKTALTRHFRDDDLIIQAIENEQKLKANLEKLNP